MTIRHTHRTISAPTIHLVAMLGLLATLACTQAGKPQASTAATSDPQTVFGPLEIGADWASYRKVTTGPWDSKTHGHRFVEIYVNDVGYEAYIDEDKEMPPGSVIVKTSKENEGGKPSAVDGPIFVMKKMESGWDPEHSDWYYAIHWAHPAPAQLAKLGGPIYWRSKSAKVQYCWDCHDNYDRELGGVKEGFEAWKASASPAAPPPRPE